jgi:hypothetical protein
MFVMIQGVKREGFSGVWRNQRFWPSAEAQRVEVLDGEPPEVDEDVFVDGKKTGTRKVADITKISKAGLEELRADGRVSIMGDGETQDGASKSEVEAAKRAAGEAVARVTALEAENAALKEANALLSLRCTSLEGGRTATLDQADPAEQQPEPRRGGSGGSKR